MEKSNKTVKRKLKEQIDSGRNNSGIPIIPQKFEKALVRDKEIITEEIVIEGRKIPLRDIRIKMLKDHQKFMRIYLEVENHKEKNDMLQFLRNINEYHPSFDKLTEAELSNKITAIKQTRNLMFWHDGSTISNHSHLMIMVACMFDPAVYLTDQEYFNLYGKHINIQSVIEKPYLYILARCRSDDSQLLYSSECLGDILNLKDDVEHNGKSVHDIARIFKGDNPACQLEAGHQKNGDYFC